jgi:hypothetical protein
MAPFCGHGRSGGRLLFLHREEASLVERGHRGRSSRSGLRLQVRRSVRDVRTRSSGPVVRRGWFATSGGVPYWANAKHGMLVVGRPGLAVGADVLLLGARGVGHGRSGLGVQPWCLGVMPSRMVSGCTGYGPCKRGSFLERGE